MLITSIFRNNKRTGISHVDLHLSMKRGQMVLDTAKLTYLDIPFLTMLHMNRGSPPGIQDALWDYLKSPKRYPGQDPATHPEVMSFLNHKTVEDSKTMNQCGIRF